MEPRGYAIGSFAVDWEDRVDMAALRAERLARAQGALAEAGLDGALLWKMENVRFVTALRSQVIAGKASILNGVLLTPDAGPFLLASGGEVDRARFMPWLAQVHAVPVMEDRDLVEGFVAAVLEPLLAELGLRRGRLGVDQVTVPLLEAIGRRCPELRVVDGDGAMLEARRRKSAAEVALVEEACAIGDAVTARALAEVRAGRRECEVAGDALQTLYYLGGELPHVVTPFVASGEHMAPPHRFATDKLIRNRDLCFIDIGAMWNGYFADIGRATVVGRPTDLQRRVYGAVHEALWAGIEAARPGRTTEDVAGAVRRAVARYGLEEHLFSLFIGHGIGVGANEPPYIGETLPGARPAELEPGMLFALEPLVWVPDEGGVGVRLEDMVLVTEDRPRVLSRVPYDEALLG
ncbi:M24 family metallopeptidase [Aciditerrimonas ferrireducens]|jgi:Xaa-Pro aminopeptidase|uniref:M24 family metallopeptidase n=1 Tax=Aciditerrimonas ferrireducens TaxID=667306 RepID=A0ABV6BZD0_9ACTN